jgi:hypothetical protein
MPNTKIFADGGALTVWFALPNYAVNPSKPTTTELNAAVNVTPSVAWENWSFGAQASNQTSDPSMADVGNTQTRGFAQFGGTISFFYPRTYAVDSTNPNYVTFAALRTPRTLGYVIIRSDGVKTTAGTKDPSKLAVANDLVYIYKVISDGWADINTGEVNFKYSITFQPQGDVWTNTIVATAVTIAAPTPIGTPAYTAGGRTPLSAYYTGRQLALTTGQWSGYPGWFDWSSSDPSKASVDKNGVVTGVATGGPVQIIATDVRSGVASTPLAVTIA